MEENYLISREELLELLEIYYRYTALECGGVDNWEWYDESNSEFLRGYINMQKSYLAQAFTEEEIEDFDFYDIAICEIENYPKEKAYK